MNEDLIVQVFGVAWCCYFAYVIAKVGAGITPLTWGAVFAVAFVTFVAVWMPLTMTRGRVTLVAFVLIPVAAFVGARRGVRRELAVLRGGSAIVTAPTETAEVAALRVKANAGDADVQFNLGWAYDLGQNVLQDDAQAVAWYRKAADQGNANAQFNLGNRYPDGRGVPQDFTQAVAWWRKAADQGLSLAQHRLGYAYFIGHGVPQDYVESHKWRNLAASRASAENQKAYAENRDAMATLMTPAQLADAQTLAREWLAAFEKRGGK